MRNIIFLILILYSFVACKRFDSNTHNLQMLQGHWDLTNIWSKVDSSTIKAPRSSTLTFELNSCSEQYLDSIYKNINYKFQIKNYQLELIDSVNNKKNMFVISKLIKDTLVLENDSYLFTYVATKTKE